VFLQDTLHVNKDFQGQSISGHFLVSLDIGSFFTLAGLVGGFGIVLPFMIPYILLEKTPEMTYIMAVRNSFKLAAQALGNVFAEAPTSQISLLFFFVQLLLVFFLTTLQLGFMFEKLNATNKSSMRWSNDCLVTLINGEPALNIRLCIEPFGTSITMPKFSMLLVRINEDGWPTVLEQEEMQVTHVDSVSFASSMFNLVHVLNDESPLLRFWEAKHNQGDGERCANFRVVVSMTAFSELYRRDVHAHAEYAGTDLVFGQRFKKMVSIQRHAVQVNLDCLDVSEDLDNGAWAVASDPVLAWVQSSAPPRALPRKARCCWECCSPYRELIRYGSSSCCCNKQPRGCADPSTKFVHSQGCRAGRQYDDIGTHFLNWILRLKMWQLILVLSGTFLFLHFFMTVLYTLSFPLEVKDDSIQDKDPCGNNSGAITVTQNHVFDPVVFVDTILNKVNYWASFNEYFTGAAMETIFFVGFEGIVPVNKPISYDVTRDTRATISVVWMNVWMLMLNSTALALFWASLIDHAAQVRFSRSAAITTRGDKAFLLIQAVPQWMPRPIVFAKVQVFVQIMRKDPGTGEVLSCRHEELPLKQSTFPVFVLGAIILHEIDENSPLFPLLSVVRNEESKIETANLTSSKTENNVVQDLSVITVVFEGRDTCYEEDVFTRHNYDVDAIVHTSSVNPILSLKRRASNASSGTVVPQSRAVNVAPLLDNCEFIVDNSKIDINI